MRFTQNAEAALQDPTTKMVTIPMTEEIRVKMSQICNDVIDLLKDRTETPFEAYMCLQFCVHTLEEMTGIRGGIIAENQDKQH